MRREFSRPARRSRPSVRVTSHRGSRQAVKAQPSRFPRAIALSVALIILVLALFYISPIFRVSQVTVVGAAAVAPDKVAQAADIDGQNILAVDRDEVARAVEQIPVVKSVRVTRKLPNEVVIAVEERHPWAIWEVKDAKFLIDDQGVVISTTPTAQGLISIVDTGNQPIKLGSHVEPKMVEMAVKLTQLLPREVGVAPKRFEYAETSGLTVVSDKGWQARFGDAEDMDYKLAALKEILQSVTRQKAKVEVIDVRYKGRPYYR